MAKKVFYTVVLSVASIDEGEPDGDGLPSEASLKRILGNIIPDPKAWSGMVKKLLPVFSEVYEVDVRMGE